MVQFNFEGSRRMAIMVELEEETIIRDSMVAVLLEVLLYGDATTTHINVTDKLEELGVDKKHWKEV